MNITTDDLIGSIISLQHKRIMEALEKAGNKLPNCAYGMSCNDGDVYFYLSMLHTENRLHGYSYKSSLHAKCKKNWISTKDCCSCKNFFRDCHFKLEVLGIMSKIDFDQYQNSEEADPDLFGYSSELFSFDYEKLAEVHCVPLTSGFFKRKHFKNPNLQVAHEVPYGFIPWEVFYGPNGVVFEFLYEKFRQQRLLSELRNGMPMY